MLRILIILFTLFLAPSFAQSNNLTLILPAADDSHAVNARLFSRYLYKHLDIEIVIRVMPGAASVVATNYLYNVAPRDGSVIGVFNKNIPLVGMIGGPNINFDATKFTWLGSTADGRKDAVLILSHKEYDGNLVMGSEPIVAADPIKFIIRSLNWNIQQITGYKSNSEVRLAFERKEIDAFTNGIIGLKTTKPQWLTDPKIKIILQFGNGTNRHALYPNVPTLAELIDQKYQDELKSFETQYILLRPFVAPPSIPKDKAEWLREGFRQAVLDPDYIADASRSNIDVSYISWKEAEEILSILKQR